MTAYLKTLLLFTALCAGVALADSREVGSLERVKAVPIVEAVSRTEDANASGAAVGAPPVDEQITQLQVEVRWLSSELSQRPRYFSTPEDDKLRP